MKQIAYKLDKASKEALSRRVMLYRAMSNENREEFEKFWTLFATIITHIWGLIEDKV